MALKNRKWTEYISAVSSYIGNNIEAKSTELLRAKTLANQAVRELHDYYPYLERWLVVTEPRSVIRGQVSNTEDSYYVYGAATEGANGLYVRDGESNGKAKYSQTVEGSTAQNTVEWDGVDTWGLLDADSTVLYSLVDESDLPPEGVWAADEGDLPSPIFRRLRDVGLMLHMDRFDIYQYRSSQPIQFHTFGGNYILQTRQIPNFAYCTYQSTIEEEYGEGTGGTVSDLPSELFSYMVLYAARHMQIVDRQANNNALYASVTDRQVQAAFEAIGMRAEYQGTIANVAIRIQNHLSVDQSMY